MTQSTETLLTNVAGRVAAARELGRDLDTLAGPRPRPDQLAGSVRTGLKIAEVESLAAIAQELAAIRHALATIPTVVGS